MRGVGGAALVFLLVAVLPAWALDETAPEEAISDLLAAPPRDQAEDLIPGRRWAVLPQFGYGPDTGPEVGVKFTDRDLAGTGITLDVNALYSTEQKQTADLSIASPHLGNDHFLLLFSASWRKDPQRDFFGLGNNDVGSDALSTHLYERAEAMLGVGWRPVPRLALDLGMGIRHVHIGEGDRDDDTPFTVRAFPRLPEVEGGFVVAGAPS